VPLRHIQQEAGCGPKPVLMSTDLRYTFKDKASLCYTSARHLVLCTSQVSCEVQSIGYHVGGGTVLLNSGTDS
jgi:hypothetical protein